MQDEDLKLMAQIVASNGRNTPPAMSIAADTTAWSICSKDHAKGTPRGAGG
jgi:hypothetical protein